MSTIERFDKDLEDLVGYAIHVGETIPQATDVAEVLKLARYLDESKQAFRVAWGPDQ